MFVTAGCPATTTPAQPPPGQQDADGNTVLVVLLAVAGVVALSLLLALFRENRTERRSILRGHQFGEARSASEDDLNALADDLRNLNVDLQA